MPPGPQQAPLSPLIAPQVAPAYNPYVFGGYGFKPTLEMQKRVTDFLTSYDMPKRLERVVIVPADKWDGELKKVGSLNGLRGTIGNKSGLIRNRGAFSTGGNVWMNASLFDNPAAESGIEQRLAHELEHLNDARSPKDQERFDNEIDAAANARLIKWLKARMGSNPK